MKNNKKRLAIFLVVTFILFLSASWAAEEAVGMGETLDAWVGILVKNLASVMFFDVLFFTDQFKLPFAVAWLVCGAVFFTFRMGFINIRAFRHAIDCVRGRFDNPQDVGEVNHFQALATALSATVGLGNIAGVAIAIAVGGPGAMFWMMLAGFLGMTSKFTECTLGQIYREIRSDGHVMGGAMEYLSRGLAEIGWARLGRVLAILFSIMCIGGSLGAGNAFQVSQSLTAVKQTIPLLATYPWIYGLSMAFLVGVVIIGGIRRIAHVTQAVVPFMCIIYVLACLWVILTHVEHVPAAFSMILSEAFSPAAGYGGFLGVLIVGFQRAAFSNEAGIGSAAIAHSAAKTAYPVREGIVALLEPFIDTIVVCTMTALVIVITGVYNSPETALLVQERQGAALTAAAFSTVIDWFPLILSLSVVLFAYSTMISWSYYGERCWSYLFGDQSSMAFRIMFVIFVFLGSVTSPSNVLDFSDLMILSMAFPNILGLYLMHGRVRAHLVEYWARFKQGDFEREMGRV